MIEERCEICLCWRHFDEEINQEDKSGWSDVFIGTCKRYPPQRAIENTALLHANGGEPPLAFSQREWQQPVTIHTDWCAEFKPCANGAPTDAPIGQK